MFSLLASPLARYLLAALAVVGLLMAYGHSRYSAGKAACQASYAAALEAQRADLTAKRLKAINDARDRLADVEGQRDTALDQLRALREAPVRTVLRIREVPANGPTCPVASIGPNYRLRWNAEAAAASRQPVPSP